MSSPVIITFWDFCYEAAYPEEELFGGIEELGCCWWVVGVELVAADEVTSVDLWFWVVPVVVVEVIVFECCIWDEFGYFWLAKVRPFISSYDTYCFCSCCYCSTLLPNWSLYYNSCYCCLVLDCLRGGCELVDPLGLSIFRSSLPKLSLFDLSLLEANFPLPAAYFTFPLVWERAPDAEFNRSEWLAAFCVACWAFADIVPLTVDGICFLWPSKRVEGFRSIAFDLL